MSERIVRVPDLWQPWGWPARLLVSSFSAVQVLMAITAMMQMDVWLPNIIGATLFVLCGGLASWKWGHELPAPVAFAIVAATVAIAGVMGPYGFSTTLRVDDWYVGAAIVVMMGLMMWERAGLAALTFVLFTAVQLSWSQFVGIPFSVSGPIMLRHAGTLIVTFAIVSSFQRVARQLSVTSERRYQREQADRVQNAVAQERSAQLARVESIAGPLLRRLQSGSPLSDAERRECELVEATLRDTMSGRGWAVPAVLQAARAARERGVTVVLLDDSRASVDDLRAAHERLVEVVAALESGRCVARLLPPGRDEIASILIDTDGQQVQVFNVKRPEPSERSIPAGDGRGDRI